MLEIEKKLEEERLIALERLESVQDQAQLDQWKQNHLGKASVTMSAFGQVTTVPIEDRPAIGRAVNAAKVVLETALAGKQAFIKQKELDAKMSRGTIDVTLARPRLTQRAHPSPQFDRPGNLPGCRPNGLPNLPEPGS